MARQGTLTGIFPLSYSLQVVAHAMYGEIFESGGDLLQAKIHLLDANLVGIDFECRIAV